MRRVCFGILLALEVSTASAGASDFAPARDLLLKVFKANPNVILEGRVVTEAAPVKPTPKKPMAPIAEPETGPGVLTFRHPDLMTFGYYGDVPFDFRLEKGEMKFVKYPKGRAQPGETSGPNKLEGKVGEWLWSTIVSVNEKPFEDFLIARLFSTEARFNEKTHRLRLRRQAPGLTLEEIGLDVDEAYRPKKFHVFEANGPRHTFEVQSVRKGK